MDELTANREAGCKDQQVRLDTILAKGSEGTGVDDLTAFSKTVTCDRLGPVVVAALDRFNIEAAKRAAILPNSPQLVTLARPSTSPCCDTGQWSMESLHPAFPRARISTGILRMQSIYAMCCPRSVRKARRRSMSYVA